MGANTIRVYAWRDALDHAAFLDTVHAYGLKVLITYYLGSTAETAASTAAERDQAVARFAEAVAKSSDHPAVLGWQFGNELNGVWNGFLEALGNDHGCAWTAACWYKQEKACQGPRLCVYRNLFNWIERAAKAAKREMTTAASQKLVTTSFADVDFIADMLPFMEAWAPSVDVWGIQLYRGPTFGTGDQNAFTQLLPRLQKPLLITEYGVDAYRDPCGRCPPDRCPEPCFNTAAAPPPGFGEDQATQAQWLGQMAQMVSDHWENGTMGGFVMSWVDEYWKNSVGVKGCFPRVGEPGFDPVHCDARGHVECPAPDSTVQSLCGYPLDATFDGYVNEGWFGLNGVSKTRSIDRLRPRQAFTAVQQVYGGHSSAITMLSRTWFIVGLTLVVIALVPVIVFECRSRNKRIHTQSLYQSLL